MLRKTLIIVLMVPILGAAMAAGTSFPAVFLMASLLLIALMSPSRRETLDE